MNPIWKKFSRQKVAIVTDSTANLTLQEARDYDITVIPLQIQTERGHYVENWRFDSTPVREAFGRGEQVTTSQPSVVSFVEQYQKLQAEGYRSIISVHLSEKLSGTCAGARKASELVNIPVQVLDSKCAAAALGVLAKTIAHPNNRFRPAQELMEFAEHLVLDTSSVFTIKNLDTLRRGGRISQLQHTFGNLLGIQPILQLRDGTLEVHSKERGRRRSQAQILKITEDFVAERGLMDVSVLYYSQHDHAYELSQKIVQSSFGAQINRLHLRRLSTVLAAHTGADILGVVLTPPVEPII